MLGVFSFHFCLSPIVLHGFGFCKYVYIGVSFFVSPLSFFKENHESNTEMKRPLLKWLMIILRLPHIPIRPILSGGMIVGRLWDKRSSTAATTKPYMNPRPGFGLCDLGVLVSSTCEKLAKTLTCFRPLLNI